MRCRIDQRARGEAMLYGSMVEVEPRKLLTPVKMYYCAYIGNFGEYACNPRTLSSLHLNHMVSLEGIVTKCSLVRPKVIKSFHYNEAKDTFLERTYQDQTMTANGAASTSIYPTQDDEGNSVCSDPLYFGVAADGSSSSRSMATAHIEIIRPFLFRKCQSGHQPGSSLEVLISSWTTI